MLVENTTVPAAALPILQFKQHLRLGSGFAEDNLQEPVLESFLRAAIAAVEGRTGKVLLERAYTATATKLRDPAQFDLPLAPISAVSAFILRDLQGGEQPIAPELWRLVADMQVPYIRAVGSCLPMIPEGGEISVSFIAGYGPAWNDLPDDLAQAVMMLAAHYYEFRHDTALDARCMPFGVAALIERFRNIRLFGGRT